MIRIRFGLTAAASAAASDNPAKTSATTIDRTLNPDIASPGIAIGTTIEHEVRTDNGGGVLINPDGTGCCSPALRSGRTCRSGREMIGRGFPGTAAALAL